MKSTTMVLGMAVLAACADGPESPLAPSPQLRIAPSERTATAFLLLPEPGSASRAFGLMALRIGVDAPPNPCLPRTTPPDGPVLDFCAVLFNPGLETLQSGSFTVMGADGESVGLPFRVSAPPSPCLVLRVAGTLAFSVRNNPGPPNISATLVTSAGTLSGGTEGQPGPPDVPARIAFPAGGTLACTVTATAG
jgi:hypothetical protein